jgi:enolase
VANTSIIRVLGRRVWDSRGRPTVEVHVELKGGARGRAIAPAGASTGTGEAVDLRDGGPRFGGLDVRRAVASVNDIIAPALQGQDALGQSQVDGILIALDGTPNKSRLGGNATIATSMAVLQAAAAASERPVWRHIAGGNDEVSIPLPEIQIFGGGAHAARRVDIQDFMVVCPQAARLPRRSTGRRRCIELPVLCLRSKAAAAALPTKAATGRPSTPTRRRSRLWWPPLNEPDSRQGHEVAISLDVAASQFGKGGRYRLALDDRDLDCDGMIELLGRWLERYPIVSVEDPLAEDDPDGFRRLTEAYGQRVQVVGDDFLVTNAGRVRDAAASGACTAVLVKPNQAGRSLRRRQPLMLRKRQASTPSSRPAQARRRT